MPFKNDAPPVFEIFPQAMWNRVPDEKIPDTKMGIGSVIFCNFFRPMRLSSVSIPCRDQHPRDLVIEAYTQNSGWKTVSEMELPKSTDSGLHEIDLHGIETRHLRFECRRHYAPDPSMFNQCVEPHNVPYIAALPSAFRGVYLEDPMAVEIDPLPVGKPIERLIVAPVAPNGMTVRPGGNQVRFFGETYSIGFSIQRPMITHLGWDAIGTSKSAVNLIRNHAHPAIFGAYPGHSVNFSGPHWRTLPWTAFSGVWGGQVAIEGNVVRYIGVNVGGEVSIDAVFTVTRAGVRMELTQRTRTNRPTLELEAWRFVWNAQQSAVATLAQPICSGRTGAASLPLIWSAPGHGGFSCSVVGSSAPVRVQADSNRGAHLTFAGLVLGHGESYPIRTFEPGETEVRAEFELRTEPLLPKLHPGVQVKDLHPAIRREWGSGLMFRPELAGFSNNALSTNCHLSQAGVADLACFTARPERGPDPTELARHTITMALKEGRGYGADRDVYLDSDPALLIGAGRIHMASPNSAWLKEIWPWLCRTVDRHLAKSADNGLIASPIPTGNRRTEMHARLTSPPFFPSNGWDTINAGHFDGISNAETYRAWKNVLGLSIDRGDDETAARMRAAIAKMRKNYAKVLWSDASGWLGTWRSRDGELHDYGVVTQNAAACLYGLVSPEQARGIVRRIEDARIELGVADASYGFVSSLRPIPMDDQAPFIVGTAYRWDGQDAFGVYCNGTVSMGNAHLYMWALSRFGPEGHADRAAREILDAHIDLDVVAGEGSGCEFHTHEGATCGYEGAYVLQFPILLAIAQHYGWTDRSTPEFWPPEAEE